MRLNLFKEAFMDAVTKFKMVEKIITTEDDAAGKKSILDFNDCLLQGEVVEEPDNISGSRFPVTSKQPNLFPFYLPCFQRKLAG